MMARLENGEWDGQKVVERMLRSGKRQISMVIQSVVKKNTISDEELVEQLNKYTASTPGAKKWTVELLREARAKQENVTDIPGGPVNPPQIGEGKPAAPEGQKAPEAPETDEELMKQLEQEEAKAKQGEPAPVDA